MTTDRIAQVIAALPPVPKRRTGWKPKPTGFKAKEPTTLYRFYGQGGDLLYVGIAVNPKNRIDRHRTTKPWWGEVGKIETVLYPTRDEARWVEKLEVLLGMPKYNTIYVMRDGDYNNGGWQAHWDVPHVQEEELKLYRKLRRLAVESEELEQSWAPHYTEWLWAEARKLSSLSDAEFGELRAQY